MPTPKQEASISVLGTEGTKRGEKAAAMLKKGDKKYAVEAEAAKILLDHLNEGKPARTAIAYSSASRWATVSEGSSLCAKATIPQGFGKE